MRLRLGILEGAVTDCDMYEYTSTFVHASEPFKAFLWLVRDGASHEKIYSVTETRGPLLVT
jgi:hypothetical protein